MENQVRSYDPADFSILFSLINKWNFWYFKRKKKKSSEICFALRNIILTNNLTFVLNLS